MDSDMDGGKHGVTKRHAKPGKPFRKKNRLLETIPGSKSLAG